MDYIYSSFLGIFVCVLALDGLLNVWQEISKARKFHLTCTLKTICQLVSVSQLNVVNLSIWCQLIFNLTNVIISSIGQFQLMKLLVSPNQSGYYDTDQSNYFSIGLISKSTANEWYDSRKKTEQHVLDILRGLYLHSLVKVVPIACDYCKMRKFSGHNFSLVSSSKRLCSFTFHYSYDHFTW